MLVRKGIAAALCIGAVGMVAGCGMTSSSGEPVTETVTESSPTTTAQEDLYGFDSWTTEDISQSVQETYQNDVVSDGYSPDVTVDAACIDRSGGAGSEYNCLLVYESPYGEVDRFSIDVHVEATEYGGFDWVSEPSFGG